MDYNKKKQNIEAKTASESKAAIIIGVSPSTLAIWRTEGIGPKYLAIQRPNKEKPRILYPLKFIDEWLENQAIQTV